MALDRKTVVSKIQRDRRIESARKKRFDALIASPGSFPLVLPEAGVIGVSCDAAVSQGELIVSTSTGRSIGTPDLEADQVWRLGFLERGVEVDISASPTGTVTLHYLDDRRKEFAVATGSF